jgi:prepilin-type N-terminal cleavage/methylation domain-containing protein
MIFPLLKKNNGFTLIELLVVISIIGLLSTIVLSALSSAKLKARDSKIKQEVTQMRTLMEQNYTDYGSYSYLAFGNWVTSQANCDANFSQSNGNLSAYGNQAALICKEIVANSLIPNFASNSAYAYFANIGSGAKYSIGAYLPGKGTFYCVGSNGKSSDTTTALNAWTQPGCQNDPTL